MFCNKYIYFFLQVCKHQHSLEGTNAKYKGCTVFSSRFRKYSTIREYNKNYYDVLGVTKDASQSEIKTAYYRLSKIYHPDKNYGCPSSTQEFKCITEAYEALTNEKLRNLYNKNSSSYNKQQNKKYMHTSNRNGSNTFARLPYHRKFIYNFDIWFFNHYGQSVETRTAARLRHERNIWSKNEAQNKKDMVVFCFLLLSFCFYAYDKQLILDQVSKNNILNNNSEPDKEN